MAYSKAWTVMREAETHFGLKLLERKAGGPTGGGSVLTDDARQLLLHFKALVDEADAVLDWLYRKHFGSAPYAKPAGEPAEMPEVDPSA
jgi:molybdate transport repressor ModE-like protein